MNIIDEDQASIDSEGEQRFMTKVKSQLEKTQVADKKLAREKLTELRLKKKRRLRGRRGDDDDGAQIAVLGGASDSEE